jgi:uncharacterized repeat protein (TIGR03803 family)
MRAKGIVVFTFLLFSVSSGLAGNEKVLYSFAGGTDGSQPLFAGVIFDQSGNLYGVTAFGGLYNQGTVFQLTPSPGGTWTETVLHSFTGGPDGAQPMGGLITDGAGNIYGTAAYGGAPNCGTVFALSPSVSGGDWTYTVLHAFIPLSDDGCSPQADLMYDGGIYGTTAGGGHTNQGTVFWMSTSGGGYTNAYFTRNGGADPFGGLNSWGFGATCLGGKQNQGVIYTLAYHAETIRTFTVGGKAGTCPLGDLLTVGQYDMYGITWLGGAGGGGTVYHFSPNPKSRFRPETTWVLSVLHSFPSFEGDGIYPTAGLTADSAGNLYGTTSAGKTSDGIVFELTPGAKNKWTETVLYSFSGPDGSSPTSNLVFDNAGNLYGTTQKGGAYNQGVVYEVTP